MKSIAPLACALFVAVSSVVADGLTPFSPGPVIPSGPLPPIPKPSDQCFVIQIVYTSLKYQFKLVLKTPAEIASAPASEINQDKTGRVLKFVRDSTLGLGGFTPVVGSEGAVRPTRLNSGMLSLVIPEKIPAPQAYIVIPPNKPIYRQIKFRSLADPAAKFYAVHACKGKASWIELRTGEPESVLCLSDSKLWVKQPSVPNSICQEVRAIIHEIPIPI